MTTPTLAHRVRMIDQFRVTPPSGSVPETHLPLTFFDVFWHRSVTVKRIFFFDLSSSSQTKSHFLTTQLPNIKQSLSLALQRFYPLAATLAPSPQTGHDEFHYTDGDSVQLTVAESDSDFHSLVADHPKDTAEFHPLVPELGSSDLCSFQLTVFATTGFSIGLTVRHVAADGSSIMQFMKYWASVCRLGDESDSMNLPSPIYDRDLIPDPMGLKPIFLDQISMIDLEQMWKEMGIKLDGQRKEHMVRATFVLSRANIEDLRHRVAAARMEDTGKRDPLHVSSFVLTCAYMWACLTKARGHVGDRTIHFSFAVDCRARMSPPIPAAYFGNCIGCCCASVKGSDIDIVSVKDNEGLVAACEVIGRAIQRLDDDGVLNGADQWFPQFCSIVALGDPILSVAGSPRLRVYNVDFGFGRPRKVEVISIEESGAMSLAESREDGGRGIEVGLALPESEMERVASLFKEGLGAN